MDEDDDPPPRKSIEEIRAAIDEGIADAAAGRTVAVEMVLADLDARIAEMEARQVGKVASAD